ncbi:hypothetical protein BA065_00895 [Nanoarchaeota archaeon NZ13-N]|nr:MAG: hypothetical protein BA065_00895 [Nanoarchaeota archaeon NZ13-N]
MKKSVEIALGTIVLLIVALIVLVSTIWLYYFVYSSSSRGTLNIGNVVVNQTNQTTEILKNITNISIPK